MTTSVFSSVSARLPLTDFSRVTTTRTLAAEIGPYAIDGLSCSLSETVGGKMNRLD